MGINKMGFIGPPSHLYSDSESASVGCFPATHLDYEPLTHMMSDVSDACVSLKCLE